MTICKDKYGLELRISDRVISINNTNDEGIISDISYKDKDSFITIVNDQGDTIYEDIPSSYCTTKERYNERENSNTILWINFHSNKGYIESRIPLNENINKDFTISKDAIGISISFDKYEKYDDDSLESYSEEIYFFALRRKVNVSLDEDLDEMIITIKENGKKDWISKDATIKIFNSYKDLKKDLDKVIDLFKTKKLNKCNKIEPYNENIDLQNAIKTLKK